MRELPFLSLPASVRESRSRGGGGSGQADPVGGGGTRTENGGGKEEGEKEEKMHLTDVKSRTAAKRKKIT